MRKLLEDFARKDETQLHMRARVFLEFKYQEIKDLLKHFLTLISASLIFSLTFSEKIIIFEKAGFISKLVVIGAWLVLILAIGACGLGLYILYLAAERALETIVFNSTENFGHLVRRSYIFQDLSGILFGFGLILLIIAAILKIQNY